MKAFRSSGSPTNVAIEAAESLSESPIGRSGATFRLTTGMYEATLSRISCHVSPG
jgi:hypothetical protein